MKQRVTNNDTKPSYHGPSQYLCLFIAITSVSYNNKPPQCILRKYYFLQSLILFRDIPLNDVSDQS